MSQNIAMMESQQHYTSITTNVQNLDLEALQSFGSIGSTYGSLMIYMHSKAAQNTLRPISI